MNTEASYNAIGQQHEPCRDQCYDRKRIYKCRICRAIFAKSITKYKWRREQTLPKDSAAQYINVEENKVCQKYHKGYVEESKIYQEFYI